MALRGASIASNTYGELRIHLLPGAKEATAAKWNDEVVLDVWEKDLERTVSGGGGAEKATSMVWRVQSIARIHMINSALCTQLGGCNRFVMYRYYFYPCYDDEINCIVGSDSRWIDLTDAPRRIHKRIPQRCIDQDCFSFCFYDDGFAFTCNTPRNAFEFIPWLFSTILPWKLRSRSKLFEYSLLRHETIRCDILSSPCSSRDFPGCAGSNHSLYWSVDDYLCALVECFLAYPSLCSL